MQQQMATLIAAIGAISVAVLYIYLYVAEKKDYFLFWTVTWALYGVSFALQSILTVFGLFTYYTPINIILSSLSYLLLARGIALFVDTVFTRLIDWFIGLIVLVSIVAWSMQAERVLILTPSYFATGILLFYCGHLIVRNREAKDGLISLFAGIALILRGVMRFIHPFGSAADWFGTWGYTTAWFLDIIIAFSLVVLYFRNLSARLSESENRFRRLADNAPEMVILCRFEPMPVFDYVSPAARVVLNLEPEALRRDAFAIARATSGTDREIWDGIMSGGSIPVTTFPFRFRRPDQREVWLEALILPLRAGDGRVVAFEGWIRDIDKTVRHDQEMQSRQLELKNSNQSLQEVNRRLWQFNDAVSNDLRTPLWRINTFSRLFEEDYAAALDETARGYIDSLRRSSQQISSFINSLIKLTSSDPMSAGMVFDVSIAARACLQQLRPELDQARIGVAVAADIALDGDPAMLRLFLDDFLENVVRWSITAGAGSISLEAIKERGCPGFRLHIAGEGLKRQEAERLFTLPDRDTVTPSHDLHRALAHRVLAIHGGWISVEESPGGLDISVHVCGRAAEEEQSQLRLEV